MHALYAHTCIIFMYCMHALYAHTCIIFMYCVHALYAYTCIIFMYCMHALYKGHTCVMHQAHNSINFHYFMNCHVHCACISGMSS